MQLLGGLRRLARQRLTLPSKLVGHIYTKLDITSRAQLGCDPHAHRVFERVT
jgi:hypothetical protein